MKKEYIQPKAKIHAIHNSDIIACSVSVGNGNTLEQNAKESIFDLFEDEDTY